MGIEGARTPYRCRVSHGREQSYFRTRKRQWMEEPPGYPRRRSLVLWGVQNYSEPPQHRGNLRCEANTQVYRCGTPRPVRGEGAIHQWRNDLARAIDRKPQCVTSASSQMACTRNWSSWGHSTSVMHRRATLEFRDGDQPVVWVYREKGEEINARLACSDLHQNPEDQGGTDSTTSLLVGVQVLVALSEVHGCDLGFVDVSASLLSAHPCRSSSVWNRRRRAIPWSEGLGAKQGDGWFQVRAACMAGL